jgi:hypothetical protein
LAGERGRVGRDWPSALQPRFAACDGQDGELVGPRSNRLRPLQGKALLFLPLVQNFLGT